MKKLFVICILLIAAMATAQESPSETTGNHEVTTIPAPTLEPILVEPILISEPISVTANQTEPTANETAEPILISEPVNETTTSTTEIVQPTIPPTIAPPECGNLYQEVGEECDTTASACGAGRWQCIDCKCVPLPEETTTTTLQDNVLELTGIQATMQSNNISIWHIIAAIMVIVVIVVAAAYKLGKDDNGKHDKK